MGSLGKNNINFHVQLLSFAAIVLVVTAASSNVTKPDCQSACGNLAIPFPFGTTPGCYLEDKFNSFFVTCNKTTDPPKSFMSTSNVEIQNITLDGEFTVLSFVAHACFNESGAATSPKIDAILRQPKFPISNTRNKFTVVGCSTTGLISGTRGGNNYTTGCVSMCDTIESVVNGKCDGSGCCQSSIPDGVTNFRMTISNPRSNVDILQTLPCSYAFVAEENYYTFSTSDFENLQGRTKTPVVLNWAVGNESCEVAQKNQSSYACLASNSVCVNSTNGPGYRCECSSGFEGNPYLLGGCEDIDECSTSNPCVTGACKNDDGNFLCSCPSGYDGDGKIDGSGCTKKSKVLQVALGVSLSFLAIVVGISSIYCLMARRKIVKLREKHFNQNGGFMLQDKLSKHHGSVQTARIFSAEDLRNATNNYDERRVIGQGGFGTVYKGLIKPNNKEVAIKKSKVSDQSQIEQFINEVIILAQINHRNVVKLLGCCLETEVPMLVYEFITNGTLADHLYEKDTTGSFLSWEMRMKIAAETAGAIAYLHSATSTPVIHRDIKSSNILLDENYTAKVADFGASKLIPLDKTQLTTLVQGTFGYLDPEYFHSSQLTEKSDVYSFGVLLAELLTGEKALCFERPEKDRNLATYFVSALSNGHILDVVDKRLMEVGKVEQIKEVAKLTAKCLRVKGDERPSMKEAAMELEGVKVKMEHPWVAKDSTSDEKETEYLLNQNLPLEIIVDSSSSGYGSTAGFDSMIHQMAANLQLR